MSALAIDVRGLVKLFGDKTAVQDVDLQVPKGEVWGFLGPNGSGKTTTIRMICGLLHPTEGEGTALGFDIIRQAREIKLRTGYMIQKFSFWQDMTIRENIEFVGRLYRMPNLKETVDRTLADLGLTNRQKQMAGALSGGWKQRMALAAISMHDPELLLLDEPTAGVDPQARRDFWDEIHRLTTEKGVTVFVSTHYMDEAERCDKIVYLAAGRKVTEGTVAEIIARSGLHTYRAEGTGIRRLARQFEAMPGVEDASYFGAALHVSGTDPAALRRAVDRVSEDGRVQWTEVRPSLEDAFIAMTQRAGVDARFAAA
ncbi:ABC transporter ATP-binding protein [uncultured Algimonas sp.]|uniref:ABC transporter ATP-binding protein n=1 Tax=uncultured Algimonas sp. TaxID=1547920 RepID=UPI00263131C4|nr:ABC transporter ATP-binding protein [uncultured Algimonas sp.]